MLEQNTDDRTITGDLKILVIGNSGAGKTSFVNKWTKDKFEEVYKATIVSEYSSKVYKYEDKLYKINLWDIAGQDHFASVTKAFAKGAHGCITMSDATQQASLDQTVKWKESLDDSETFADGGKLPNVLVQNKAYLLKNNEIKDRTELEKFSKKNGFDAAFKTSAKTGLNINESMDRLIEIIIKRNKDISAKEMNLNRNTVSIDPEKNADKDKYRTKQTGCC